jgi:hypothetical protein
MLPRFKNVLNIASISTTMAKLCYQSNVGMQAAVPKSILWSLLPQTLLVGVVTMFLPSTIFAQKAEACKVCERISLFNVVKARIGQKYWGEFSTDRPIPLIYFSDSNSYVVFGKAFVYSRAARADTIICPSGLRLERIPRLDKIPFYMQNKTNFSDTASPYYYNPTMFCSDPEGLRRVVPEFTSTEHWLQLLMHEYFHAFQLSHDSLLAYFGRNIRITEDSLDRRYLSDSVFANALLRENSNLLAAINSNMLDTTKYYARRFLTLRAVRRTKHFERSNMAEVEDFWEKMEGPARYVEYYMGLSFPNMNNTMSCDTMFRAFAAFKANSRLEETEVFVERAKINRAYYYATGFNLCRLLDKLGIDYKGKLFNLPGLSLTEILSQGLAKR